MTLVTPAFCAAATAWGRNSSPARMKPIASQRESSAARASAMVGSGGPDHRRRPARTPQIGEAPRPPYEESDHDETAKQAELNELIAAVSACRKRVRTVDASEVTRLADVEPREVLLAKLAGAMKGNLTKAAGLFQAPLSQVARLAAALQEKKPAADAPAAAASLRASAATASTNAVIAPAARTPAAAGSGRTPRFALPGWRGTRPPSARSWPAPTPPTPPPSPITP